MVVCDSVVGLCGQDRLLAGRGQARMLRATEPTAVPLLGEIARDAAYGGAGASEEGRAVQERQTAAATAPAGPSPATTTTTITTTPSAPPGSLPERSSGPAAASAASVVVAPQALVRRWTSRRPTLYRRVRSAELPRQAGLWTRSLMRVPRLDPVRRARPADRRWLCSRGGEVE